jgi:hypothetical protein
MQWKLYWRNVVQRYRVLLTGWPANIPFKNLSEMSISLVELEGILRSLRSGKIHWRVLTETEFNEMEEKRGRDIDDGKVNDPAPRRRRSDFGKKRRNTNVDDRPTKRPSKKHKSPTVVDSDADSDADVQETQSAPAPTNIHPPNDEGGIVPTVQGTQLVPAVENSAVHPSHDDEGGNAPVVEETQCAPPATALAAETNVPIAA